mgnify:FL=1
MCKKHLSGFESVTIILDEDVDEISPLIEQQDINQNIQNDTSPLDPRFNFDNFIVGKSNEFAFAAAKRVCESEKVVFNPLFIFGGVV